jgi:DUF1680 family protein
MRNFRIAAGKEQGVHAGYVFQDSDVAKWIEGAAFSLRWHPDPELEATIDAAIEEVVAAQQPDGYLDTYFTLERPSEKFRNLLEGHELYCAGHMMEAAVALYEATGNEKLLSVMKRNGDLLYHYFVEEGHEGYPGHPEVELALMRLWRASGDDKYKTLAEHFINVRGVDSDFYIREVSQRDWKVWGNDAADKEYQQSHLPVREQPDAVGHSVRAAYLYTAMADIAAVTREPSLMEACFRLFDSIFRRSYRICRS